MSTEINENNLLTFGFIKNYKNNKNGFYSLYINSNFMLTVSFKNMAISLHKKYIGHIIEFKNINSISDIENLIKIIK